jgi:hypothetical protein
MIRALWAYFPVQRTFSRRSFFRRVWLGCTASVLGASLLASPYRAFAGDAPREAAPAVLRGAAVRGGALNFCQSEERDADDVSKFPEAPVPRLTVVKAGKLGGPEDSARSSSAAPVLTSAPQRTVAPRDCPYDHTHAKGCGVNWGHLAIESSLYLTFQNAGNVYTGYWYRWETTHGKWWDRYIDSTAGWRWNRWSDDNPLLDDYVGHPIMGSITNWIWIQNDGKGKTLEQGNNWPYYRSRLRAMAFSTAYSFQWKLGPFGEAGIGHNGDHYYYDKGKMTNETGWVELVTTPVGGTLWTMTEDALDKHVIKRLERESHNPLLLTTYQILNPSRATANFLRLRAPWYRDSRTVKADGFWSDTSDEPEGSNLAGTTAPVTRAGPRCSDSSYVRWGGKYELGTWWGVSWQSGQLLGNETDTKYMPIDIRYSEEISQHRSWSMRYSPEVTALAMLDVPEPGNTNPLTQRRRSYGSGLSPEGFQLDFLPEHRVQPFLSQNGGVIFFLNPALSAAGSHVVYTADFGAGVNIFHLQRQAVTLGYRYQHLHDADLSAPVKGTDANTFYLGISRFRVR